MNDDSVKLFAAAMVLFAEVSAMNAENEQRKHLGSAMAYNDSRYTETLKRFTTS